MLNHWKFYLRAVINAILDVAIHAHGMTEEEAIDLMVRGGFQEKDEARAKWLRAPLTATQLSTYYLGSLGDVGHGSRGAQAGRGGRAGACGGCGARRSAWSATWVTRPASTTASTSSRSSRTARRRSSGCGGSWPRRPRRRSSPA